MIKCELCDYALGVINVLNYRGRMDIDDLDRAIKETKANGNIPLAVVGTAGTTVLGAFDDFNKIADLCQAQKMWFHIDVSIYTYPSYGSTQHAYNVHTGCLWRVMSNVCHP